MLRLIISSTHQSNSKASKGSGTLSSITAQSQLLLQTALLGLLNPTKSALKKPVENNGFHYYPEDSPITQIDWVLQPKTVLLYSSKNKNFNIGGGVAEPCQGQCPVENAICEYQRFRIQQPSPLHQSKCHFSYTELLRNMAVLEESSCTIISMKI